MFRRHRLMWLGLVLGLLGFAPAGVALAGAPILQLDLVGGDDGIFIYQDLSVWYAPGEVITLVRGGEVVGRLRVVETGPVMSRLEIYDTTPGKLPRPGDRLVGEEMPPKGPAMFSGSRTGYPVMLAVDNTLIIYENLSAFYPPGSVFRLVDDGVTLGLARLERLTGSTATFIAELPASLAARPGMRLYPTEEPAPLHPLLAPEQRFIGRGQAYDDEMPMGPRSRFIPGPKEPELALPTATRQGREVLAALDEGEAGDSSSSTVSKTGAADSGNAAAAAPCPARVDSLAGTVNIKLDGGDWKKAELGTCLFGADAVKTGPDSGVALALNDGGLLKISAGANAVLSGVRRKGDDDKRDVDGVTLDTGELWAEVAASSGAFDVTTPTGVVSVRGTEFSVRLDKDDKNENRLQVFTLDGSVDLTGKDGKKVNLLKGKTGRILGAVLGEALDFDINGFRDYLDSWKNLLTPGGIRDFIKAKAFDMIQQKLNEELNKAIDKVIPGGSNLVPGGVKLKGF